MTDPLPAPADALAPDLSGRIALVTGATRGIGTALAQALAAAGAQVVAVGRTQGGLERLDDLIKAAGGPAPTLVPLDLREGEQVDVLGRVLYDRFGRLDILVGNAGVLGPLTPVSHLEPRAFGEVLAVNLLANQRLIRAMEPLLKLSDAGRAVFVTSGVARRPRAFWGGYAASKAALESLVACWADELSNTPVRASLLEPGPMPTKLRTLAYPGEDHTAMTDPAALGPLLLQLVRPDQDPPPYADFRTWRDGLV